MTQHTEFQQNFNIKIYNSQAVSRQLLFNALNLASERNYNHRNKGGFKKKVLQKKLMRNERVLKVNLKASSARPILFIHTFGREKKN